MIIRTGGDGMIERRRQLRVVEVVALLTETGACLPAHGRLLPALLGEPDGAASATSSARQSRGRKWSK